MHQIVVREIEVDVVRKDIKNSHLAVYPPDGRVRIAVPKHLDDNAVRLMVIDKMTWIRQQQQRFRDQERQTEREYVSGESHYFRGQRYRLDVVYAEVPPQVRIRNSNTLELRVRTGTPIEKREEIVSEWYRQHLKAMIPPLIERWEPIVGVQVADWRVKKMKTKWGSCNIEERRIWLNLELAKKPVSCVEYIIVHEMVHFLERNHNDRFKRYMDEFLPNWKQIRTELNREPLSYENWTY